ncbi:MAG: DNA methyltransferase [Anaerolineae bacterium]
MSDTAKPSLPDGFAYHLDLASEVTADHLAQQPVHHWFYFPHSFSPQLVQNLLAEWGIRPGACVLDPFVGAGVTLCAAKSLGVNGIGTDIMPLAVFVTNAKLGRYCAQEVKAALDAVKRAQHQTGSSDCPRFGRLIRAFTEPEYAVLQSLGQAVAEQPEPTRTLLRLALVRTAREFSRAKQDGGWFRWADWPCRAELVAGYFASFVQVMVDDIASLKDTGEARCQAYESDARDLDRLGSMCDLPSEGFDAVITSPPYPNRHDYTRVFHIELLSLGLDEATVMDIRHRSIRSHVEARPPSAGAVLLDPPGQLTRALSSLPENTDGRVRSMLAGYFADLATVLRRLRPLLAPGGHIAMVLGNVRYGGVVIPVDEIVMELGKQAGLTSGGTWVARLRGNSAQQMGRHGRIPSRESVVILNRPPR